MHNMHYLFFKCTNDNLLIRTPQMSYIMSETLGLMVLDLIGILYLKCFIGLKKRYGDMGATDECKEMAL